MRNLRDERRPPACELHASAVQVPAPRIELDKTNCGAEDRLRSARGLAFRWRNAGRAAVCFIPTHARPRFNDLAIGGRLLNREPYTVEGGDCRGLQQYVPAYVRSLVSLTGAQLLERPFPPREMILSPWLPEQGLAMIYAERGIGKTWVGLNVGHAVSGGGPCNDPPGVRCSPKAGVEAVLRIAMASADAIERMDGYKATRAGFAVAALRELAATPASM